MPIGASLTFGAPALLAALALLPVLWWLLRVRPPAPRREAFPPVRLLIGLPAGADTPHHTPLPILILRMTVAGLLILAAADPLLERGTGTQTSDPLVLVLDDGFAAAASFAPSRRLAEARLAEAARAGRLAALVTTAPPFGAEAGGLAPARDVLAALRGLAPKPWASDRSRARAALAALDAALGSARAEVLFLADGLAGADPADFRRALEAIGPVTVALGGEGLLALADPTFTAEGIAIEVRRLAGAAEPRDGMLLALDGEGAPVASARFAFADGAASVTARILVPLDAQDRVTRIVIEGVRAAAAVALVDDGARRRLAGLALRPDDSVQPLLAASHFAGRALEPFAELRRAPLAELIALAPPLLVLPDGMSLDPAEAAALRQRIEEGMTLLRFAGPALAAEPDDLVPSPLRQGGRILGTALDWTTPQRLAPFEAGSPFLGLAVPEDVTVRRQILAEPGLGMQETVWARLEDGTPLVTARALGRGWLVLFHVTATPDWSSLPYSGLFVGMMRRIADLAARGAGGEALTAEAANAALLPPLAVLDASGRLGPPPAAARALASADLGTLRPGPDHPPGLYGRPGAARALNLAPSPGELEPLEPHLAGLARTLPGIAADIALAGPLLAAALLLLALDGLLALALAGRLRIARAAGLALGALVGTAADDPAQADEEALAATLDYRLAYIVTGVPLSDRLAAQGLEGLSLELARRTAVEPGSPLGLDPGRDELRFFPLVYWRVTAETPDLGPEAAAAITRYVREGGTLLIDTADHGLSVSVGGAEVAGPAAQRLRALLGGMALPRLEPLPADHLLTRTFFLLDRFPGRYPGRFTGGTLWIEADAGGEGEGEETLSRDGVASLIVGSHDWAAAWAIDGEGRYLAQMVPGSFDQREFAYRFGINLVTYALTGSYKDDAVHVGEIMKRLGE